MGAATTTLALACHLAVCGCETASGTAPLVAAGVVADRAVFGSAIGPLLAKKCGDAGCHGRAERPFALFATGARRSDPAATFRKTALTSAEVDANYAATLGFADATDPRQTTLLRKSVGLLGHRGGPTFEAFSDPAARAIAAWLTGQELP